MENKVGASLPEPVIFRKNEEGALAARIDNLEICFDSNQNYSVIVWGYESIVPCEEDGMVCPEEKGRTSQNCAICDECPYEEKIEAYDSISMLTGDRIMLQEEIRRMFLTGEDGLGHDLTEEPGCQPWPEPAASFFARAEWQFEA